MASQEWQWGAQCLSEVGTRSGPVLNDHDKVVAVDDLLIGQSTE
jgi:hypothetical protein